MKQESFNRDLKTGEDGEEYILSIIRKTHPMAHKVAGKFKPYDIYVPERNYSYEVKTDLKSHETGNVFIEISFNNTPSGLMTTKANMWAYITKDDVIYATPNNIKNCIIYNGLKFREFEPNDDSERKSGFIISRELFDQYARKVAKRD